MAHHGREACNANGEGVPLFDGHLVKMVHPHKLHKLGPKGNGGGNGPITNGVIIRCAPSLGGVEHHVSSTSIELLNGEVMELGGGRVDEIPPKSGKHVPQVIGIEVGTLKRDGIGGNC